MLHILLAQELESFLKQNGIKHPTSAAYHPASNGLPETAVQTLKSGLKNVQKGSLESRIAKVLFTYRIALQGLLVLHQLNSSREGFLEQDSTCYFPITL